MSNAFSNVEILNQPIRITLKGAMTTLPDRCDDSDCYLNSSTIVCCVIRNDIIVPEVLSGVFHLIKQLTHVIESLTYTPAKPEKRLMDLYLWSASNHYLSIQAHLHQLYLAPLTQHSPRPV
jgi:hypothetical protein